MLNFYALHTVNKNTVFCGPVLLLLQRSNSLNFLSVDLLAVCLGLLDHITSYQYKRQINE
jgi:hypothetical protein